MPEKAIPFQKTQNAQRTAFELSPKVTHAHSGKEPGRNNQAGLPTKLEYRWVCLVVIQTRADDTQQQHDEQRKRQPDGTARGVADRRSAVDNQYGFAQSAQLAGWRVKTVQRKRLNTSVPLVPPKPKLFFTATSMVMSRAVLAQ